MIPGQARRIRQAEFLTGRDWKRVTRLGTTYYRNTKSDERAMSLDEAERIERTRPRPVVDVRAD